MHVLQNSDSAHWLCNNTTQWETASARGLIDIPGIYYQPNHWRLFTDVSLYNNKATLLHKGNIAFYSFCTLSYLKRDT